MLYRQVIPGVVGIIGAAIDAFAVTLTASMEMIFIPSF
jgi:hypothetical protein